MAVGRRGFETAQQPKRKKRASGMELTMNVIEEGEVDYESTPEDERVALKARKEERVAKERQAAEVQAHKETKQSASEPEPEAKVDTEEEEATQTARPKGQNRTSCSSSVS
ncbi:unnamed protein product [Aphanomyces euteiches]